MSTRTPGGDPKQSQNLESHIPSRPFQFSSLPQGRGSGGNNSTISNQSKESGQQEAANVSSERSSGTMKGERDNHAQGGDPSNTSQGSTGTPSGPITASNNAASSTTNAGAGPANANGKGRAGGGASDFVKKLYRCV